MDVDRALSDVETKPLNTEIGFQAKSDRANGVAAIVDAQIVTMENGRVISDGVVIWSDGRTVGLGPEGLDADTRGCFCHRWQRVDGIAGVYRCSSSWLSI